MRESKSTLMVDNKKEQRSVSICDEKVVMDHTGIYYGDSGHKKQKETPGKQKQDVDRKESTASFLNPAISFARRMSLKITGSRGESGGHQHQAPSVFPDSGYVHRRARRAPRNPSHWDSFHRPSISSGAHLSIHMEHGVIMDKKDDRLALWWNTIWEGGELKDFSFFCFKIYENAQIVM